MTFSVLPDDSILIGGTIANVGTYLVEYVGQVSNITGIRLEAIEHPTLPHLGPGTWENNGNFILTEMTVDAGQAPEPPALALLTFGLLGLWRSRRHLNHR